MKLSGFLLGICCAGLLQAGREKIDQVVVLMHHPEGTILILESDLRPDLSDKKPSVREALLRELILLDAKKLKIPIADSEVDRHIARVQEQLKMTRADLIDFFKQRGFTFEQGRKELEKSLLIESTVEHRVKSKAYVPKQELEKYYKDHPLVIYSIRQAFIPFSGSKTIQRAVIERDIENGTIAKTAQWQDPVVLKDSDFSQEKTYIKDLAVDAIVKVQETEDGIVLLQLVEKRTIPFEERKQEIAMDLGRERYKNALTEYYDMLMNDARPYIRTADQAALSNAP